MIGSMALRHDTQAEEVHGIQTNGKQPGYDTGIDAHYVSTEKQHFIYRLYSYL
jgi:hypothetical protein